MGNCREINPVVNDRLLSLPIYRTNISRYFYIDTIIVTVQYEAILKLYYKHLFRAAVARNSCKKWREVENI